MNMQIFSFLFSLLINGGFARLEFIVSTACGGELSELKNGMVVGPAGPTPWLLALSFLWHQQLHASD